MGEEGPSRRLCLEIASVLPRWNYVARLLGQYEEWVGQKSAAIAAGWG